MIDKSSVEESIVHRPHKELDSFWWILFQCYHDTSQVTEELVQKILLPGLEPGAVDVFLEFICYSGGPLPEELLPQVKVSFSKSMPCMLTIITLLLDIVFDKTNLCLFPGFLFTAVPCFDSMGWQGSMGAHWAWKSLWEIWFCWRFHCPSWCWPLPSGLSPSLLLSLSPSLSLIWDLVCRKGCDFLLFCDDFWLRSSVNVCACVCRMKHLILWTHLLSHL